MPVRSLNWVTPSNKASPNAHASSRAARVAYTGGVALSLSRRVLTRPLSSGSGFFVSRAGGGAGSHSACQFCPNSRHCRLYPHQSRPFTPYQEE